MSAGRGGPAWRQAVSQRLTFVIAPAALVAWFVLLWLMFGDVL